MARPPWVVLLPHLARAGAFLVPVLVSLLLWAVGTGSSILSGLGAVSGRGVGLGPGADAGLILIGLCGICFFGLIWLIMLFVGVREVIADDGLLIRGAAGSLEQVCRAVQSALDEDSPPLTVRRDQLVEGPVLRVGGDREEALIVLRAVASDLRVGWTMWRTRSTVNLVIELLPGRRGMEDAVLQAEGAGAMWQLLRGAVERGARAA